IGSLLFFLCDWLTDFPFVVRLLLLAGGIAYALYWFWRGPWQEIKTPLDEERLSLIAEKHLPELHSRLISTVQLRKQDLNKLARVMSPDLVKALFRQTYETVPKVPITNVVDRSWMKQVLPRLIIGVLLWGSVAALFPAHARVFLQRLVWPYATYPTRTRIEKVEYPAVIPEQTAFIIKVKAAGEIPITGQLELTSAKGFSAMLELKPMNHQPSWFQVQVPPLLEKTTALIKLGDARSEEIILKPTPRPHIKSIKLMITPPAYTRIKPFTVNQGNAKVVAGSKIELRLTSTKPLRKARLMARGKTQLQPEMQTESPTVWTSSFVAEQSFAYSFELIDSQDLQSTNLPEYRVSVQPDRPPRIIIKIPEGAWEMAPQSKMPFAFQVEDDYRISRIRIMYHIVAKNAAGEFSEISSDVKLKGKVYQQIEGVGKAKVIFDSVFDASRIGGLQPGQQLRLWVEADDNKTPQAQTQRSEELIITMVTAEEYQRILLQQLETIVKPVDEVILNIRSSKRVLERVQKKGGKQ
ncbi:MAG: DUF4175 family protein, partial [Lentisphaerae bacterium]